MPYTSTILPSFSSCAKDGRSLAEGCETESSVRLSVERMRHGQGGPWRRSLQKPIASGPASRVSNRARQSSRPCASSISAIRCSASSIPPRRWAASRAALAGVATPVGVEGVSPVCGSTDHPHLAHPSALNEIAARLRRRREEIDAALTTTGQRLDAATRALSAGEARQMETNRGIDVARGQILAANSAYGEQLSSLNDLCTKAGIEESVPPVLDDQAASQLAAHISVTIAERSAIATPLANVHRLRTEIDGLQREHDTFGEAIETTARSIDQRRSDFHAAQLNATEYTVLVAGLAERLISIRREITPFLSAEVWRSTTSMSIPSVLALRCQQSRRVMLPCANRFANLK